jgi:hypothetical protein
MAGSKKASMDEKREYPEEILEKPEVFPDHLYEYTRSGLTVADAEFMHGHTKEQEDKIFSKVDWRVCPMLAVLYLISHLDRLVYPWMLLCY